MRIRHRTSTERTTELSATNAANGTAAPGGRRRWQRVWRVGLATLAALALAVAGIRLANPPVARAATTTDITTCDYATLANTITHAASGDTLQFGCNGVIYFDSAHGGGGTITIGKTLTISGAGHSVTLSGGDSVRQFVVQGSSGSLKLDSLTLANGKSSGTTDDGGAIANKNGGTLTITNSTFSNNSCTSLCGGGGIENTNGSSLTITHSTFNSNSADLGGGAILNEEGGNLTIADSVFNSNSASSVFGGDGGAILNRGSLTITNSAINANSVGALGGGIYNQGGALTITTCTFSDNSAPGGGGGIWNSGTLSITNSTLSGNKAEGGNGGGVFNNGALTIANSTLSGNSASGPDPHGGGGVFNGGTLTITNTTLTNNSASGGGYGGDGGGVWNVSGAVTITKSAITNNVASSGSFGDDFGGHGGGLYSGFGGAQMIVSNSTIANNSAGHSGGGVFNGSSLTIINGTITGNSALGSGPNSSFGGGGVWTGFGGSALDIASSIVAGNMASSGPSGAANCIRGSGVFHDSGYNLTNTNTSGGCPFSESTDVLTATPGLGSLAYNGGPTKTIALLTGSPAIDRIPSGVNGCGTTIKTDQRGASRPQWGKCDIGAFEYVYGVKLLYNASKANQSGSAIPIKVQLTNTSGANVSAADITLTVTGVKNLATGQVSPHSGVFKFEESSEQGPMYLFVLKTTGYATGSYALLFRATGDPMTHEALFAIR